MRGWPAAGVAQRINRPDDRPARRQDVIHDEARPAADVSDEAEHACRHPVLAALVEDRGRQTEGLSDNRGHPDPAKVRRHHHGVRLESARELGMKNPDGRQRVDRVFEEALDLG